MPAAALDVKTGAVDQESVRQFIQRLTDAAGRLPSGLDSPVELAMCDGRDLQFIDRVDVSVWTTVPETGPLQSYVLIRRTITQVRIPVRGPAAPPRMPMRNFAGSPGATTNEAPLLRPGQIMVLAG